ncbi:MAG TPA: cation-translocating P-type ATPase [Ottowia sp.]|jgi:Cd2+/Zn2+-exporting ATPase|nr:MAG: HAD family hydrolase [Burkholderiales bacterium 68-10]HMT63598.1 cation-translocating P-type ATPase [Ottowia sp.]HMT83030.1 cation-translocating P-type ATPase [Ottowia sp.]HOK10777.1 cation-translocating P-type ATPase [Ottowia sp.]HOM20189.1 cation-translocating P-type ATPase [Ottowia sp.]
MSNSHSVSRLQTLRASPTQRRGLLTLVSGTLGLGGVLSAFLDGPAALTATLWIAAALIAGSDIAVRAWHSLRARSASIELLVTIAAVGAIAIGEYWEAAAVTFLFLLGGYLEARTIAKTRSALKDLIDLAPTEVTVRRDGTELVLAPHQVLRGDTVIVRPGGRIGVDGTVLSGRAAVNQAAITGESMPEDKSEGSSVFAGTVSHDGYLEIRAEGVGADTTLAHIIQRVEQAQEAKAPIQRFIERFAQWYTPAIIVLTILTYALTGNIELALTLLVVACPGALVISTPISVIAGIGQAARQGVLIKGGEHLETAARIRAVAFDKTGTLTVGRPAVTSIVPLAALQPVPGIEQDDRKQQLLRWTAVAEGGSEHPLARAILREVKGDEPIAAADNFETFAGGGIGAGWQGRRIEIGSPDWLRQRVADWPTDAQAALEEIRQRGETLAAISVDGKVFGLLGFADQVRPEAAAALQQLRDGGVRRLVMLTGDHLASAQRVARTLGITEVQAGLLPEHKLKAIERLRAEAGVTAMVGDGINDAPALAAADVGVAMGAAGTDVAIDTADIALMTDDLERVARAITLARATVRNIRQNTGIALLTVAGLLAGVFAGEVHMAGGMFIHQASVLLVILNGMRLMRPRGGNKAPRATAGADMAASRA